MFIWTFLLRITHTIIFQSIADSFWITLYTLGNVKCRQYARNWTNVARGQTHAVDWQPQRATVSMNDQPHLRMCSIKHNIAVRCAGTSRNHVVLFPFTRRSTGEITADGPWSSGEAIRFRKTAQETLRHSVPSLYAAVSIRMIQGTILQRLWVKRG
jgi:hypothetical protein